MKLQSVDGTIRVQSSNIELGAALTQHCRENIEKAASKLFGRIHEADVHFRREGAMTACSIRIKVGALNPWAAEISHHNPYRAFNNALRKVTEQMRRAKSALREDHGRRLDQNLGITRPGDAIRGGPLLQPTDEGKPDLSQADDYTRAQTQAGRQDRMAISAARDIRTMKDRPQRVPEAAE